jgi:hypothetical protein
MTRRTANSALLADAYTSPLRAQIDAAKANVRSLARLLVP